MSAAPSYRLLRRAGGSGSGSTPAGWSFLSVQGDVKALVKGGLLKLASCTKARLRADIKKSLPAGDIWTEAECEPLMKFLDYTFRKAVEDGEAQAGRCGLIGYFPSTSPTAEPTVRLIRTLTRLP
jgi:hypothetical protein